MASINELPPDQVAVLRLLLGQGSSYSAISSSLHIQEREVRRRAEAALDSLASVEPPPASERDQVTDYLLGQQDASAQEKSRRLLSSSAAAGAWARSLREPLVELGGSVPVIPPAGSAARVSQDDDGLEAARVGSAASGAAASSPPASRSTAAGGERRGGRILLAALAGLAILAAGLLIGRATAPDSNPGTSSGGTNAAQADGNGTVIAAARLKPPAGSPAAKALGLAAFGRQNGQVILGLQAKGMPKPAGGSGYGVWLTGGSAGSLWLGYAAVNTKGQIAVRSVVPTSPSSYRTMLITLESTRNPKSPGKTYLSGAVTTAGS